MSIYGQIIAQWQEILAFLSNLRSRGIAAWDESVNYVQHARVMGDDGKIYRAKQVDGPNPNIDPTKETADPRVVWELDSPSDIAALTGRVGNVETGVSGLRTDLGTANGRIDALIPRVGNVEDGLGTANGRIDALANRVGDAETDVGDLRTDLGNANTAIGALTGRVDGLAVQVQGFGPGAAKAWGFVTADGQLSGGNYGATVSLSGTSFHHVTYRITLDEPLTSGPCIPIVMPTYRGDAHGIKLYNISTSGFEVRFVISRSQGEACPFYFVVYAGAEDDPYTPPTPSQYVLEMDIANEMMRNDGNLTTRSRTSSLYTLKWNTAFDIRTIRRAVIGSDGYGAHDSHALNRRATGTVELGYSRTHGGTLYAEFTVNMANIVKTTADARAKFSSTAQARNTPYTLPWWAAPSVKYAKMDMHLDNSLDYANEFRRPLTFLDEDASHAATFDNRPGEPQYQVNTSTSAGLWRFRLPVAHDHGAFSLVCDHIYNNDEPIDLRVSRIRVPYSGTDFAAFEGQ